MINLYKKTIADFLHLKNNGADIELFLKFCDGIKYGIEDDFEKYKLMEKLEKLIKKPKKFKIDKGVKSVKRRFIVNTKAKIKRRKLKDIKKQKAIIVKYDENDFFNIRDFSRENNGGDIIIDKKKFLDLFDMYKFIYGKDFDFEINNADDMYNLIEKYFKDNINKLIEIYEIC
jgi:hypothetical protein